MKSTAQFNLTHEWWKVFQKESNDLTESLLKEEVIPKKDLAELEDMVFEVIRKICSKRTLKYGFRVWVDNEQKNIHFIRKHIFNNFPENDTNVESWANRILPNKKFCFVINHANKFSDSLTQKMSLIMEPLVSQIGIPMDGMHIGIFIGNYGFTPFGIHQDPMGAYFFNFHLGPGEKVMYNWNEDEYVKLKGTHNNINVQPLLSESKEFNLNSGSIYFMPWDKFHIAKTDDFSISLSVWFDNHTTKYVSENLFFKLFDKLEKGKESIPELVKYDTYKEKFHLIENYLSLDTLDKPLRHYFFESYNNQMLLLLSNCGWSVNTTTLEEEINYNILNTDIVLKNSVQIVEPFKIYTVLDNKLLKVFARGHILTFPYEKVLLETISELNTGKIFKTDCLNQNEEKGETIATILSSLYNCRAIKILG